MRSEIAALKRLCNKHFKKREEIDLEFYSDQFFTYNGRPGIPYTLRKYQVEDLRQFKSMEQPKMFLMYNRRAGKDSFCWPLMIDRALEVPGNYAYMLPDREQAAKVIWRGAMIDKTRGKSIRFIDMIPKELILSISHHEKIVRFKNGSVVYLTGANRPDSLRGITLSGIVFSEFAFYRRWDAYQIVMPVMAQSKGWIVINTTPCDFGFCWSLFKRLQNEPAWYTRIENVETLLDERGERYITEEDVQQAAIDGNMPDWLVRREFYCEPALNDSTLYYAAEMKMLADADRIRAVQPDMNIPIHFAFDLGNDATPIIGFQVRIDGTILVPFYHKPTDEVHTYSWYWNMLKEYVNKHMLIMGQVVLPHDAVKRQVTESTITSAEDVFSSMGATVVRLKRVGNKDALIVLSKMYLVRTFIGEQHQHLIDALSAYGRKYDEKLKVYSNKPNHDWASHPADCWQYAVQAIEECLLSGNDRLPYYRELR